MTPIIRHTGYPIYNQSEAQFLSPGETFWERLLEELEKAKKYIFMEYFIIEEGKMWNSILDILKRKAQEGVLVRRIYEYTDGFMHSKTFVSDDKIATVGTVNLDYRSLYLHFECGAVFYNNTVVGQVKDDFLETLKTCQAITVNDCKTNVFLRMFQALLRLFAPLM